MLGPAYWALQHGGGEKDTMNKLLDEAKKKNVGDVWACVNKEVQALNAARLSTDVPL